MIKYRTEKVETRILDKIICDVCKKEYDYTKDFLETQEFQCININGGYGSVFGDGVQKKADVCQHCIQKLLGEYLVEEDKNEVL